YRGTVHLTSTDGSATLPADYTFTAGDAGSHTFAPGVTFASVGSQTLTATDAASSSVTGSESAVGAADAGRGVRLERSFTWVAGRPDTVTVSALDDLGHVDPDYRGTVELTSSDPFSTAMEYTFTAADAGVHSFDGFVLGQAGGAELFALDEVVTSITGSLGVS